MIFSPVTVRFRAAAFVAEEAAVVVFMRSSVSEPSIPEPGTPGVIRFLERRLTAHVPDVRGVGKVIRTAKRMLHALSSAYRPDRRRSGQLRYVTRNGTGVRKFELPV